MGSVTLKVGIIICILSHLSFCTLSFYNNGDFDLLKESAARPNERTWGKQGPRQRSGWTPAASARASPGCLQVSSLPCRLLAATSPQAPAPRLRDCSG